MSFIKCFGDVVCVKQGETGLASIEQVMNNNIYFSILSKLTQKLEEELEENPNFKEYIDADSEQHIDMKLRVACLLSNKNKHYFGVTDQMLEMADNDELEVSQELKKISDLLYDQLEESMDIDVDIIDQLRCLFLALDSNKIKEIQSKEKENVDVMNQSVVVEKESAKLDKWKDQLDKIVLPKE